MFQIYQPSGKFSLRTFPIWLAGILATVGLAYIYQNFLRWIPWIYVNVLLTAAMGLVLGWVAAQVVRLGSVRSRFLAIVIGLSLVGCGVGAKYFFQYRGMLRAATTEWMRQQNLPAAQRAEVQWAIAEDLTFARHLQFRADQGWNIGRGGRRGAPIQGVLVYLIWAIEAGVIGYFALRMPYRQAGEPFSESRDTWASESELVMTLPITEPAMVEKILAATRIDDLLDLPIPKTDESNQFAMYTVHSIPGDEMEDAYLSVNLATWIVNNQGEPQKTEKPLVRYAILPVALRRQLAENASLLQEALNAYREAVESEAAAGAAESPTTPGDDESTSPTLA